MIVDRVKKLENIKLVGLHFHIGSQITSLKPYIVLCKKVNIIQKNLHDKHHTVLQHLNFWSGLGINYKNPEEELIPNFENFFKAIHKNIQISANQRVDFELGHYSY